MVTAKAVISRARAEPPQVVKSCPCGSKALFLVPVLVSVGIQMSCQSVLEGSP
jgi:hypothetical protein